MLLELMLVVVVAEILPDALSLMSSADVLASSETSKEVVVVMGSMTPLLLEFVLAALDRVAMVALSIGFVIDNSFFFFFF
ncbi:uncharacterized protein EV154DRAFT_503615, partial [Mucor mucedo]|uniref:uncharacterized protein n=1 Tax=Mucor mucedo TaxID=29922 RepID=UPI00221F9EA3